MKINADGRRFPALDEDAPDVPKGLRPRQGVDYGCGDIQCRDCYEVAAPRPPWPASFDSTQEHQ